MSKIPLISFKNVSFSYFPSNSSVLNDISFNIFKGEIVCILGPNGGGKTTLMKLMTGLLKPVSGSIDVLGDSPGKNGSKIGYMPQSVHYDPSFPISVRDVVLMGLLGSSKLKSTFGFYSSLDKKNAELALEKVGMKDFINRHFSALSGGQKQRVLIARAIISNPEILILDEPTSNVDSETENSFMALLKRLNIEDNKTIIMVSHDMGFVTDIVSTVFCVNRRLAVHPTNTLSGEIIQDIYKSSMQLVRHDHRCSEKGHS